MIPLVRQRRLRRLCLITMKLARKMASIATSVSRRGKRHGVKAGNSADAEGIDQDPGSEPRCVNPNKYQAADKRAKKVAHALSRSAPRQELFLVLQDHINVFLQVLVSVRISDVIWLDSFLKICLAVPVASRPKSVAASAQ